MAGKKPESVETKYIRHLIRDWERRADSGGMVALQTALSKFGYISRTQLIHIRDSQRGAGPDTEDRFAAMFHEGSRDALRAAAEMYVATVEPGKPSASPDPYKSRPATIEWMRTVGIPDQVVERVQSVRRRDGRDPGPFAWVRLAEAFMASHESGEELGEALSPEHEEKSQPKLPAKGKKKKR